MDIEKELSLYDVSRETQQKLADFVALLQSWNTKMNLVSRNSMEDVWQRHVLDSLQLIKYFPQNVRTYLDIGSGAGFPGIVLAIALSEKQPQARVVLVESITKKTVYLKDVCAQFGLVNTIVENSRVENISLPDIDVITARAVASLDVLCAYSAKLAHKNTTMLFLKGKSYEQELEAAQLKWRIPIRMVRTELF